jgi:soluble lytic murein transglycosylase-like protein
VKGESVSGSIPIQKSVSRSLNVVSSTTQHIMMIACLALLLVVTGFVFEAPEKNENDTPAATRTEESASAVDELQTDTGMVAGIDAVAVPKPHFLGALDYVKRRYRVSPEAVLPIFEVAELIGQERRIDPLLILAIIGVESGFNPFAESPMGARGLMQVIPRFHMDKVPEGMGIHHLFDPAVNIHVGVRVLEEAIRRRGGLIAGLQYYAGSSDSASRYANRVLAEKARLEKAAQNNKN